MTLSVIIPVYNEAATVKQIIKRTETALKKLKSTKTITDWEIIIVDDGSSDKTVDHLTNIKSTRVKIFRHPVNQGKGAALRTGFAQATGEIFLTQDADLEYHPDYYNLLLAPILSQQTQVVYGSRLGHVPLNWRNLKSIPLPLHFVSNKFLSWLTRVLYGQPITDMETGYKVFTRSVYQALNLKSKGFEIEVELTAKIIKAGYEIKEVPITTEPRNYSQGKKITFTDGVLAIWNLFYFAYSKYWLAVAGIILLSCLTRFWNFTNRYGLWNDQARDVLVARVALEQFNLPLIGSFSSGGPFTFGPVWYHLAMLAELLPGSSLNYWLVSGLLSVLMVILLMRIAYLLLGKFGTLAVGLLAAISPAAIGSALASTQHSLVPVTVSIMLWGLVENQFSPRNYWLLVAGLGLGLSLSAHYQSLYILPIVVVWFLVSKLSPSKIIIFGLAAALPLVPMLIFDLEHQWWNLTELVDYYRFGQHRVYVPNRWLSYVFDFWPRFWSYVTGGWSWLGLLVGISLTLLVGREILTRQMKKSWVSLVLGFGLMFIWFRYFKAERSYGYVAFAIPFVLLFSSYLTARLYSRDKLLGIASLMILALGTFHFHTNTALVNNSHSTISQMRQVLVERYPQEQFVVYDFGNHTPGCSMPVSLFLSDWNLSQDVGRSIGVCRADGCTGNYPVIVSGVTGDFECQLVDLSAASTERLEKETWKLASPREVHRATIEWWKTEPKLNSN